VSAAWTAPLDRAAIEAIIPHRDPFLLVDEITELVPGERAAGRYHVTDDAWYLRGHFPGRPIMPGVLQVEALAQVGAVCGLSHPDFAGRLALFAGIDDVRFKRIVVPGDTLELTKPTIAAVNGYGFYITAKERTVIFSIMFNHFITIR